jgi:type I restriction enzyme S subunit
MIPEGWKKYKISDLVELIGGGTPKTSVEEYWNGSIPWLSVVDINSGQKHVYETEKKITEKGLKESSTKILKKGQLVISARGTVGEIAVLGKDMAFNQSCYGLNANEKTTNGYLYYLIKSSINHIRKKTHGAVFNTITKQTFDSIDVIIPNSLSEQSRIASILSSLDDKIELNLRMNKTLEAIAQAIFKEWFVDFRFPGFDGELVDGLPKGWRIGNYSDIAKVETGKGLKREEYIPNGQYSVKGANGEIGKTDQYLYDDLLILTGRVGTLGQVYISRGKCWISDNVIISKPLKYSFYTYLVLKSINLIGLNRGSTQPLITQTDLKNQCIIIPDDNILGVYENFVFNLYNKIDINNNQNHTLCQIRDNLLPKLMTGKIRVA